MSSSWRTPTNGACGLATGVYASNATQRRASSTSSGSCPEDEPTAIDQRQSQPTSGFTASPRLHAIIKKRTPPQEAQGASAAPAAPAAPTTPSPKPRPGLDRFFGVPARAFPRAFRSLLKPEALVVMHDHRGISELGWLSESPSWIQRVGGLPALIASSRWRITSEGDPSSAAPAACCASRRSCPRSKKAERRRDRRDAFAHELRASTRTSLKG